jgi:AcrR family transcriptional regulator
VPAGPLPTQARAQATRARILDVAAELLVERGADGVTMTDVADRAQVSIGSLYRWFPAQPSLVRALAHRHLAAQRAAALEAVGTPGPAMDRLERALRAYLGSADDPLVVQLVRAISSDAGLRELDRDDTRVNANLLTEAVGLPPDRAAAVGLVIDLAGHLIVDLAERTQPEREAAVATFVRMARAALV